MTAEDDKVESIQLKTFKTNATFGGDTDDSEEDVEVFVQPKLVPTSNGHQRSAGHGTGQHAALLSESDDQYSSSDDEGGELTDADFLKGMEVTDQVNEGRARNTSTTRTMANVLKSYVGSGILGLPYAFKLGGPVTGTLVLMMVAVLSAHCMVILVKCKDKVVGRGAVTYGDVAYNSYGKIFGVCVDISLMVTQFGFCVVYLAFVATSVSSYFPEFNNTVCRLVVLLISSPIFIGFSFLRSLKTIGPISQVAMVALFVAIIMLFVVGSMQMASQSIPGVDPVPAVVIEEFPLTFGICVYAFEGIGLVIPSETAMSHPQHIGKVVVSTTAIACVLYILMGLLLSIAFGSTTSDHLADNLEDFAVHSPNPDVWYRVEDAARGLMIVGIAFSFPSQFFPVADMCEDFMYATGRCSMRYKKVKQYAFRAALVFIATTLAFAIPQFGLLTGFVGAFGSTLLQFVYPPLMALKLLPEQGKIFKGLCIFYIIFGIIGCIAGTGASIVKIVQTFSEAGAGNGDNVPVTDDDSSDGTSTENNEPLGPGTEEVEVAARALRSLAEAVVLPYIR